MELGVVSTPLMYIQGVVQCRITMLHLALEDMIALLHTEGALHRLKHFHTANNVTGPEGINNDIGSYIVCCEASLTGVVGNVQVLHNVG